ncbi:MAG: patatin-like phospholipase family protein [Spirochaetaceae bacterium]|jgi:NTE family protein|nr:patatin-like phospholipase family protein [Spirochaetaceae bacterium]
MIKPTRFLRLVLMLLILLFSFPVFAQSKAQGRKSVALVLSGGGTKGYALLPILELIEELEIPVDMVIGTSAGAIIGGLYSAGYSAQTIREKMLELDWPSLFNDRPVYPYRAELSTDDLTLGFSLDEKQRISLDHGISTGQNAYKIFKTMTAKIPSYIDFDKLPVPFRAAAVNTQNTKLELLHSGDIAEAIRASMSLPGIFDAFIIDDVRYLDGGIRNNLPISEAKSMGYDIIIAVDLFSDIEMFDNSTSGIINDLLELYFSGMSKPQYKLADIVISPDIRAWSILDFTKAHEIYKYAESQKEEYRRPLLDIKTKIYGGNTGKASAMPKAYGTLPYLTPAKIEVEGALENDNAFIIREFDKKLAGKPLTEKLLGDFIARIYNTGNYAKVLSRLDARGADVILRLELWRVTDNDTKVQITGSYSGTFVSDTYGILSFKSDVLSRNFADSGSIISLGVQLNNLFSARMFFVQPLSHHLFLWSGVSYTQETNVISTLLGNIEHNAPLSADTSLKVGFQNSKLIVITGGLRYFYLNPASQFAGALPLPSQNKGPDMTLGIFSDITMNTLDSDALPTSGLFYKISGNVFLPLPETPDNLINMLSAQTCMALSLERRFSILFRAFAGAELSGALYNNQLIAKHIAWNSYDRMFFPQSSSHILYGAYKGSLSLSLQYHPRKVLTIFGGVLIFSITAAAQSVFWKPEDFELGDVFWNIQANAALRFTPSFAARLGAGGARNAAGDILPFVSIDIGTLRY